MKQDYGKYEDKISVIPPDARRVKSEIDHGPALFVLLVVFILCAVVW